MKAKKDLDNYGKPKLDYKKRIGEMNDSDLFSETKHKIWLSAYANNNPRSDFHWHVDYIYNEWVERKKENEYARAYKEVADDRC